MDEKQGIPHIPQHCGNPYAIMSENLRFETSSLADISSDFVFRLLRFELNDRPPQYSSSDDSKTRLFSFFDILRETEDKFRETYNATKMVSTPFLSSESQIGLQRTGTKCV
ncbi:hypothetical protein SDJN03_11315, partial [Cucurbita argyrosperma subsp. sororia]